jgi:hypothetical protein
MFQKLWKQRMSIFLLLDGSPRGGELAGVTSYGSHRGYFLNRMECQRISYQLVEEGTLS